MPWGTQQCLLEFAQIDIHPCSVNLWQAAAFRLLVFVTSLSSQTHFSNTPGSFEEECGIDNRRVEQIENGNLVLGFQKETNVDIIILFYSLPSRSIIVKFLFM